MDYETKMAEKQRIAEHEAADALKRPERAERLIRFLDKTNAYETFHDLNSNDIDFEKFESFLVRLNGITRGIPIKERQMDGFRSKLTGGLIGTTVLHPQQEDKKEILKLAFDSTKKIGQEDVSYMLPVVVNSLHIFRDANGRVSRTLHLLLDSPNKEAFYASLEKALGIDGRFDTPDINPDFMDYEILRKLLTEKHGWSIDDAGRFSKQEKLKGGVAMDEYSKIDKSNSTYVGHVQKFEEVAAANFYYIMTAVVDALPPERYDSLLLRDKWLSPIKMATLSEQEWTQIFDLYYQFKKEHAETFVYVFTNPKDYVNPWNDQETMKDMFIRRVGENFRTGKYTY